MYLNTKDNKRIDILHAVAEDWEDAMALAWRTFSRFEAPIYPRRGSESFIEFISGSDLRRMFMVGRYRMYLAKCDGEIVGLISLRDNDHISLLFVDAEYQGLGIGRALMSCVEDYVREREVLPLENEDDKIPDLLYIRGNGDAMTVYASPIAVEFYHKLGFYATGPECLSDGILITPMKKSW